LDHINKKVKFDILYYFFCSKNKFSIMFKDISLSDYDLSLELEWSYFLVDCLYEEISVDYEKRHVPDKKIYPYPLQEKVIIYKKQDNGISEEISLDELIFYIQVTLPRDYKNQYMSKEVLNKIDLIRKKYRPFKGECSEIERQQLIEYDCSQSAYKKFLSIFRNIDNIKKAIDNLEILFKYDKTFNSKEVSEECDQGEGDGEEDEGDDKHLMKEVSTKKYS
jgi:hypothetical protein